VGWGEGGWGVGLRGLRERWGVCFKCVVRALIVFWLPLSICWMHNLWCRGFENDFAVVNGFGKLEQLWCGGR